MLFLTVALLYIAHCILAHKTAFGAIFIMQLNSIEDRLYVAFTNS